MAPSNFKVWIPLQCPA